MKKLIWIVIIILIIWLLVASVKDDTNSGPLKIGVLAPLSGPVADYGEEIKAGVLAGKGDAEVEFVFEDEQCDAKAAVSAFQKLTTLDKVSLIIGPGCGSPQEAIVPLLKEKGVVMLVPSAASRTLYDASAGQFFNAQYSLEDESKFVAEEMLKRGFKKVALVTYGNAFSATHAKSFKENYKGEIASDVVLLDDNANLLPELTKIKSLNVDAIYAPDISFFFGTGLAKMEQLGLKKPVFTTYVAELPAARPLVTGVFYSFPENIMGTRGAIYELSKEAAEIMVKSALECDGDSECVKENLLASGDFNEFGVSKRGFVMKQLVMEQ